MPLPQVALDFLSELGENNSKEWFSSNKKRYERELKNPARALAAEINTLLQDVSPAHAREQPHKALNRINRDIRFSKDKTPYNTKVWAGWHNTALPKGAGAGFYFGVTLDSCGVGCGAWHPPKEAMESLRHHIADHHQALSAILADLPSEVGPVKGDKYKRVPKPWTADHPAAELLKHKGIHLGLDLPRSLATSSELLPTVRRYFEVFQPLVAFLDDGLGAA
jgi:uncharacterized protein (TIGR02453 family)